MEQSNLLYDQRFLESYAGSIISDPATAVVELVANCWDAYSTDVTITWPDFKQQKQFKISDNGHGMTRKEFQNIWRTISYNRIAHSGPTTPPPEGVRGLPRPVFGKNGKGRFASFCFASAYEITSRKDGQEFKCRVRHTDSDPLILEELSFTEFGIEGHGTEIIGCGEIPALNFTVEKARELIGSRFLSNPAFHVTLGGKLISFNDIPDLLSTETLEVTGIGKVQLLHINTKKADKSTKQRGIAWWVQNRLVGNCTWSPSDYERILDGRTSEAKRFTFIVKADYLNSQSAVAEDWSGFDEKNSAWVKTRDVVQDRIREIIFDSNHAEREDKRGRVLERIGPSVNRLAPASIERVKDFVGEVVDKMPGFGEEQVFQLTAILTNLEKSKSRYGLLEVLHNQTPNDLDALHDVLTQWTVGMAKVVLDEVQNRLKLINELRIKIQVSNIDEVKELQPLFAKGLWMFGDKFESIHFTSNKGMTTVIRELFDEKAPLASRNRPDYVVTFNGSAGFYSTPSYNNDNQIDGIQHLVIVDLKTTKLPLGSNEKEQIWKYVKELKRLGHIKPSTRVDGFILGDQIDSGDSNARLEDNGMVVIQPLKYDWILARAEQRLLKLYEQVKEAPFLLEQQEELSRFMEPIEVKQDDLLEKVAVS
jgi:hypothetical protein